MTITPAQLFSSVTIPRDNFWGRNRSRAQRFDAAVLFSGRAPAEIVNDGQKLLPISRAGHPIVNKTPNGTTLTFHTELWSDTKYIPYNLRDSFGRGFSL